MIFRPNHPTPAPEPAVRTPRPKGRQCFGTTCWSVVLRAGNSSSSDGQHALNELVQGYWYPLYAFCRRRGHSHHDALDLTQGFFTHLVSGDRLSSVSPDKGRFRTFLLAAFKNFMANEQRAANALRRGGAVTVLSLDSSEFSSKYDGEPVGDDSPELYFERRWVDTLLARVRKRLAAEYQRAGKEALYEHLEPHLLKNGEALPRSEISRQLRLSAAAVSMSVHRMRRRYGEILREEVAATVDDPAEIEDELRSLLALVSQKS